MEVPTVAFDESGNTGPDLLNQRQPIFSLASVCLADEVAQELLAGLGLGGGEAKFSDLRRDPDGQAAILQLLQSEWLNPQTARVAVFHKPYTVVAKMVDHLLEPGFYKRGMAQEFRSGEGPLRWPTTLYQLAPKELGDLWSRLQEAYIAAVRHPSPEHTAQVVRLVEQGLALGPDVRVGFPLEVFAEQADQELGSKQDVDPLDPAIPGLVEHMDSWGQAIGPFRVVHDHTTSLERVHAHLMRLCDPSIEKFEVPGSDRTARFPLQVVSIEFADSKALPQVQIADLVAGTCSFQQGSFVGRSADADFAAAVAATGVRRLFSHFVAPPDFVQRSMEAG